MRRCLSRSALGNPSPSASMVNIEKSLANRGSDSVRSLSITRSVRRQLTILFIGKADLTPDQMSCRCRAVASAQTMKTSTAMMMIDQNG